MLKRSLKVDTQVYLRIGKDKLPIKNKFIRAATYQAVRVIDIELDIMYQLYKRELYQRLFSVEVSIVNDNIIQQLNNKFRHIDTPTDVLSFPAWEGCSNPAIYPDVPLHLGEIVISLDTALRQSQEDQVSLKHMVAWLIAHSMLHLIGLDHPDEKARQVMRHYELKILKAIGFTKLPTMAEEVYHD
ncbi:rRNA maturation RNase YbeY [bacterium]|nr:rRNA maturation RNase YbeY [bacterium]